jgi:hypothetical protein
MPRAVGRMELFARLGRITVAETMIDEAFEHVSDLQWRNRHLDNPHGDSWFTSMHVSSFPGGDPRPCPRKLAYGLMAFATTEKMPQKAIAAGRVGVAAEDWVVSMLDLDGRLLSASVGRRAPDWLRGCRSLAHRLARHRLPAEVLEPAAGRREQKRLRRRRRGHAQSPASLHTRPRAPVPGLHRRRTPRLAAAVAAGRSLQALLAPGGGGVRVFALFVATVWLANWLVSHFGIVDVGFGLAGARRGLRGRRRLHAARRAPADARTSRSSCAVVLGGALSYLVAPAVRARVGVAFLVSELADFAVYTPLRAQRRGSAPSCCRTRSGC